MEKCPREAENWYRMLVERVPAVVYVDASDEASSSVYMSPQSQDMLGYAPEEWLFDPELWVKTLHPDDRERVVNEAERTRRTGEQFRMEYRLVAGDGRVVWVRDEASMVKHAGEPQGRWWGVLQDITERKEMEERLKESEEVFRVTFELAGVGMAHLAPDGRWLRVNGKLLEISGYSREELVGMTLRELTPPEDHQASSDRTRRILEGKIGPYSVERRYVRKDGSRVWVNLSVSLVRKSFGEPDFLICVAEDITSRKLAELVPDPLTGREIQVLELVVRWQTDKQIAQRLGYSEGTIKSHIHYILTKLGVRDRRRAAARAVEIGLVSPLL